MLSMNSSTSEAFRKQLADLAADVQRQARDPRVPKANATVRERPPTKVLKFSKEKGLLRPFPFDG